MARRKHIVPLGDGRVAVDIGHDGRRAIFPAKENEHDFTGSSDDWERRVFINAVQFRLHRFHGKGGRDEAHVTTFPEAMTMAAQAMDDPEHPNARVIIYAVADSERFVSIPQSRWPFYLELWNKERSNDVSQHPADKPQG